MTHPSHEYNTPTCDSPFINIKAVIWSAIGLVLLVTISMLIVWQVFGLIGPRFGHVEPVTAGEAYDLPTGTPELEAKQVAQRLKYEHAQKNLLTTYGWVDEKQQLAHIPIERAMELTIEQYKGKK